MCFPGIKESYPGFNGDCRCNCHSNVMLLPTLGAKNRSLVLSILTIVFRFFSDDWLTAYK